MFSWREVWRFGGPRKNIHLMLLEVGSTNTSHVTSGVVLLEYRQLSAGVHQWNNNWCQNLVPIANSRQVSSHNNKSGMRVERNGIPYQHATAPVTGYLTHTGVSKTFAASSVNHHTSTLASKRNLDSCSTVVDPNECADVPTVPCCVDDVG